jgi:hypothetical protein
MSHTLVLKKKTSAITWSASPSKLIPVEPWTTFHYCPTYYFFQFFSLFLSFFFHLTFFISFSQCSFGPRSRHATCFLEARYDNPLDLFDGHSGYHYPTPSSMAAPIDHLLRHRTRLTDSLLTLAKSVVVTACLLTRAMLVYNSPPFSCCNAIFVTLVPFSRMDIIRMAPTVYLLHLYEHTRKGMSSFPLLKG